MTKEQKRQYNTGQKIRERAYKDYVIRVYISPAEKDAFEAALREIKEIYDFKSDSAAIRYAVYRTGSYGQYGKIKEAREDKIRGYNDK